MQAQPAPIDSGEGERDLHAEIAARAYQLWQARGCPHGSPDEDWFQAEKELLLEE